MSIDQKATGPAASSQVLAGSSTPRRFRAGGKRNARLGRPLKLAGRVRGGVDEALLERIGKAMMERDELGARLAVAMRLRAGDPERVTMKQLRAALAGGLVAVSDAPPALVDFFTVVEQEPDWLDWDLLDEGARVYRRLGQNAQDVLLQLSLVGGYRFGGPTDLLVATGGLTGGQTVRRLAETQKWGSTLSDPGTMVPPREGHGPGEGWRLTVHVRAMHALVNHAYENSPEEWDCEEFGLPINQADMASTLGLFDGVLIIGARALGVPFGRAESRALMHLWKYVGWLLGVDEEFLVDDEWERHRFDYHVLLAQGPITEAGPKLAHAVVQAQAERHYVGWPAALQGARATFEQERLLSMLTVFLGPSSMREFGLPIRPPWAHAYLLGLNTWRYRVIKHLPGGRDRLWRWGHRRAQGLLASYFRGEQQDVGALN
ncbi:MAG: DUF2236 domain-containing protein [Nocardioidaceae bacterium]|nr:DUF2236 domain-containing protein [Nocardioidaceae bacterium]